MSLITDGTVSAFSGGTFAQGRGSELSIVRSGRTAAQFTVEFAIEWLKVAPDGKGALLYGARGTRIWRWREGFGVEPFLEASTKRDLIGAGFIFTDGAVITLASQGGKLRAISEEGVDLVVNNLRSPHAFSPRNFIQLPGSRVALTGSFFSDYCDIVVTVQLQDLLNDSEAVQHAIRVKAPVWDRAVDIAVGPCRPNAAVVLRDPEDNEIPQEDDDIEDLGDVGNFAGIYVRELSTGTLIERHPYTGRAGSGAPIAATKDLIAVQVMGGTDIIYRATGTVQNVPKTIVDVAGLRLAKLTNNNLPEVTSLETFDPAEPNAFMGKLLSQQ